MVAIRCSCSKQNMASSIWLAGLTMLACSFLVCAKSLGYNVVTAEEFHNQIVSQSKSELLRVAYFATGESQGPIAATFKKNFRVSGEYLKDFKIMFMTIDCKNSPVDEYCKKPRVDTMVFVFRGDMVMDEMPLEILYSMDSIVANMLHLALLTEVPMVQSPLELSAINQKNKGVKNVIFGKLMAIGTPADRAFMEGAFAYSTTYQFVMTTTRENNLLANSDIHEWDESDNRVWYFDCVNANKMVDCERVIYRGPMDVHDFAVFLKMLQMPSVLESGNLSGDLFKTPLHETLGVPIAYVITTAKEYDENKAVLVEVAAIHKGNLVFAINATEFIPEVCPKPPTCMIIKAPGKKYPMELRKSFNFDNVNQLVKEWIRDYFFDPEMNEEDEDEDEGIHEYEVPEQEVQDDSVALAVDQMKPHKLNLTTTPPLTVKTFQNFLDDNKVAIVAFTIRWDPRSQAFLQPFLNAATQLMKAVPLDHSPLARVECSNWPDVCEDNNVTAFPTIKIFRNARLVTDYRGPLNTNGILRAFYLHSTPNPILLSDSDEVEALKNGRYPKWSGELLQAVTLAYIPEVLQNDAAIYKEVGHQLHGDYLLGLCTGRCANDAEIDTASYLSVYKWNDIHQPKATFKSNFAIDKITAFIEDSSLSLLPELTPASLPIYFGKGLPFLILFHVPGEESDLIERALVKLALAEDEVIISWMDASPQSVGSHLLFDYNFKGSSPPNLVFLDHSTSRVCNFPDVQLIKSEKALLATVKRWIVDLKNQEGFCNVLDSGHYEPLVPSYDFLALKKEYQRMKNEHEYGGRGRFGSIHPNDDEGGDSGEQREWMDDGGTREGGDVMEEMFGEMEGYEDEEGEVTMQHGHIEL